MKNKPKKSARDPLVQELVTILKKKGVRCGTGDQMDQLRKTK
jgi:hypothetical protein